MANTLEMIVATGDKGEIGLQNQIPWHCPEDLKHFKEITSGHVVIMGRTTYESILKALGRPLPKRQSWVLSRQDQQDFVTDHVRFFSSKEDILETLKKQNIQKAFIAGGAQIYQLFFPYVTHMHWTRIHYQGPADTYLDIPALCSLYQKELNPLENIKTAERHYQFLEFSEKK
jgi:dihydrofolate reductase